MKHDIYLRWSKVDERRVITQFFSHRYRNLHATDVYREDYRPGIDSTTKTVSVANTDVAPRLLHLYPCYRKRLRYRRKSAENLLFAA
jgi:hypothetical protein